MNNNARPTWGPVCSTIGSARTTWMMKKRLLTMRTREASAAATTLTLIMILNASDKSLLPSTTHTGRVLFRKLNQIRTTSYKGLRLVANLQDLKIALAYVQYIKEA